MNRSRQSTGGFFADPCAEGLRQGDVIAQLPFPEVKLPKTIYTKLGNRLESAGVLDGTVLIEGMVGKGLHMNCSVELSDGLLLTQDCDLAHGDNPRTFAQIRPARELALFRDATKKTQGFLFELKRAFISGRQYEKFLLIPPYTDEGELAYVSLLRTVAVLKETDPILLQRRQASLSEDAKKYLQNRLMWLTGRFALSDSFWHDADDSRIHMSPEERIEGEIEYLKTQLAYKQYKQKELKRLRG